MPRTKEANQRRGLLLTHAASLGDWFVPVDVGGGAGTTHSADLKLLALDGYLEKDTKPHGQFRTRTRYKISNRGLRRVNGR